MIIDRKMSSTTIEDIRQAIHKFDLINRPYIVFIHPYDVDIFKDFLSKIEEKIVIQPTPNVERGKVICIKREDLESWVISLIKGGEKDKGTEKIKREV